MRILKKGLCFALVLCMMLSGIAFAEAQAPSAADPGGAGDWLAKLYEDNGLQLESQDEAYGQLGREISAALGMTPEGMLQPGSKLLRFLTTMGNDELTGNHFQMPDDDWGKLRFMLTQGLLQYELIGKLHAEPELAPNGQRADLFINMDAGLDNDQCLSMDGSVRQEVVMGDGSTQIEGDDMYVRINQQRGEERIKLPFMDELSGMVSTPQSGPESMLIESLGRDAAHWANAIDILYAGLRSQPELKPLFVFLFEGGEAPANYAITSDELYKLTGRVLHDLSSDDAFIAELSKTALPEMLVASHAIMSNVVATSESGRKMSIRSALMLLAGNYARLDKSELPTGEIQVGDGYATLLLNIGEGAYGEFDFKLDFSFRSDGADSFEVRGTTNDENQIRHFNWLRKEDGSHALSYSVSDKYSRSESYTLNIGARAVTFEFGSTYNNTNGRFECKQGMQLGSYTLSGEIESNATRYVIKGNGTQNLGTFSGVFDVRAFGRTRFGNLTEEGASIFNGSYSFGNGHSEIRYTYDDSALWQSASTKLGYVYMLDLDDDKLSMSVENIANGDATQLGLNAHKQGDTWTGDLNLDITNSGEKVEGVLNGTFIIFPGSFTANLTFKELESGLQFPGVIEANWTDETISAKLEATIGAPYRILLNARMSGEDACEGTLSWQNTQAAPTEFAWFFFGPTGYDIKMSGGLFNGLIPLPDMEYAMNSDPNNIRYINVINDGQIDSGYKFTSVVEGDTRHTEATLFDSSFSGPQTITLDSKIVVAPEGDRWTYDFALALPGWMDNTRFTLSGEDVLELNMQSGADALKLTQNVKFRFEESRPEESIVGDIQLNHRFRVDERKHKAPKKPVKIEEYIPAPGAATAPDLIGDEADPDAPEENGNKVEIQLPEEVAEPLNGPETVSAEDELTPFDDIYDSGKYTYLADVEGVTLTAYSGEQTELLVPFMLEEKPVTMIGEELYSGKTNIISAILPDSLLTIGSGAFRGCTELEWLYISAATTVIAPDAFEGCSESLIIVAPPGSAAEAYANEHSYIFAPSGDAIEEEQPIELELTPAPELAEDGLLIITPEVEHGV